MRRFLAGVALALGLCLPGLAAAVSFTPINISTNGPVSNSGTPVSGAYYIAATGGSDSNACTSAGAPCATWAHVLSLAGGGVIYAETGTYGASVSCNGSTAVICMTSSSNNGVSILAYPGNTPSLSGGSSIANGIYIYGVSNVTIRWMQLINFTSNGITASNAPNLTVDSNTVENIASTAGSSQAAILLNNGIDAVISHNTITTAGYNGIGLYSNNGSTGVTGATVDYNNINSSMGTGSDGGCLYIWEGQTPAESTGVTFNNNVCAVYGTTTNASKGIYLDDYVSNVSVTNNIFYGSGSYCIQYHGGGNDVVENNICDITDAAYLGLYQGNPTTTTGTGNVFEYNIVYSSSASPPSSLWVPGYTTTNALTLTNNRYYDPNAALPNTSPIVDTAPTTANPGFVNAAANNYAFTGSPPCFTSCGGGGGITVTDLGNVYGTGTATSLTVNNTVAAGSLMVVFIDDYNSNATVGTVTDSAGDTFHQAEACFQGGNYVNGAAGIWYAYNAIGLTGGVGTITYTVATTDGYGAFIQGVTAAGMNTTSAVFDTGACGTGTGTAMASGSITPAASGDLVLGWVGDGTSANPNITQSSGFSAPPNAVSGYLALGGNLTNSGVTAQNYQTTAAVSDAWASPIAAFKVAGGATPTLRLGLLLGVGR